MVCIFYDLVKVKPPRENNKQERNKEIISINNVVSPDLPVASSAAHIPGDC